MVDHDVSKFTDQELENIVREHPPTSHLRTKSLDEVKVDIGNVLDNDLTNG